MPTLLDIVTSHGLECLAHQSKFSAAMTAAGWVNRANDGDTVAEEMASLLRYLLELQLLPTHSNGIQSSLRNWLVVLGHSLCDKVPRQVKLQVIDALDDPSLDISNGGAADAIHAFYHALTKVTGTCISHAKLVKPWANRANQLHLLTSCLACPKCSDRIPDHAMVVPSINSLALGTHYPRTVGCHRGASSTSDGRRLRTPWNNLAVIMTLYSLAQESEWEELVYTTVKQNLWTKFDVIVSGLLRAPMTLPPLLAALRKRMVKRCFLAYTKHDCVLQLAARHALPILAVLFSEIYQEHPNHRPVLVDAAIAVRIVDTVLQAQTPPHVFELALAASRRDALCFSQWLRRFLALSTGSNQNGLVQFTLSKAWLAVQVCQGIVTGPYQLILNAHEVAVLYDWLASVDAVRSPPIPIGCFFALCLPLFTYEPTSPLGLTLAHCQTVGRNLLGKLYQCQVEFEWLLHYLATLRRTPNNRAAQQTLYALFAFVFQEVGYVAFYQPRELAVFGILFGRLITDGIFPSGLSGLALQCVLDKVTGEPRCDLQRQFGWMVVVGLRHCLSRWPKVAKVVQNLPTWFTSQSHAVHLIQQYVECDLQINHPRLITVHFVQPPYSFSAWLDKHDIAPGTLVAPSTQVQRLIAHTLSTLTPSLVQGIVAQVYISCTAIHAQWFCQVVVRCLDNQPQNCICLLGQTLDHSAAVLAWHRPLLYLLVIRIQALLVGAFTARTASNHVSLVMHAYGYLFQLATVKQPWLHTGVDFLTALDQHYLWWSLDLWVPFLQGAWQCLVEQGICADPWWATVAPRLEALSGSRNIAPRTREAMVTLAAAHQVHPHGAPSP
ncbi:CCR4-NOT core subunit cdc39 [Dimargaris xerosporica]|nr:CCR4-NOT core subunit cdc39 [Dimargaris xerosporica]